MTTFDEATKQKARFILKRLREESAARSSDDPVKQSQMAAYWLARDGLFRQLAGRVVLAVQTPNSNVKDVLARRAAIPDDRRFVSHRRADRKEPHAVVAKAADCAIVVVAALGKRSCKIKYSPSCLWRPVTLTNDRHRRVDHYGLLRCRLVVAS